MCCRPGCRRTQPTGGCAQLVSHPSKKMEGVFMFTASSRNMVLMLSFSSNNLHLQVLCSHLLELHGCLYHGPASLYARLLEVGSVDRNCLSYSTMR